MLSWINAIKMPTYSVHYGKVSLAIFVCFKSYVTCHEKMHQSIKARIFQESHPKNEILRIQVRLLKLDFFFYNTMI